MLKTLVDALADYHIVLRPDQELPEWWAGAPSVALGPDGTFYLAVRMREGNSPRGRRGYEVRLLASRDGLHFEPFLHLTREAAGVPGFERPALVFDKATGLFRLYLCAGLDSGWTLLALDPVADPHDFDLSTLRPVLAPTPPAPGEENFARILGYKDPFVLHLPDAWHLFTIAYDRLERPWHFVSSDGFEWRPAPRPILLQNTGWHDFFTRPACVLPLPVGFLLVYEGSSLDWRDPVYNIATGLAFTCDFLHVHDLTPDAPLLKSTTPAAYHTWRYSHWLFAHGKLFVYFEAACPDGTNELRCAVLPPDLFAFDASALCVS